MYCSFSIIPSFSFETDGIFTFLFFPLETREESPGSSSSEVLYQTGGGAFDALQTITTVIETITGIAGRVRQKLSEKVYLGLQTTEPNMVHLCDDSEREVLTKQVGPEVVGEVERLFNDLHASLLQQAELGNISSALNCIRGALENAGEIFDYHCRVLAEVQFSFHGRLETIIQPFKALEAIDLTKTLDSIQFPLSMTESVNYAYQEDTEDTVELLEKLMVGTGQNTICCKFSEAGYNSVTVEIENGNLVFRDKTVFNGKMKETNIFSVPLTQVHNISFEYRSAAA